MRGLEITVGDDDVLDRRLAMALGPGVAATLTEWGGVKGLSYRFAKEFTNGRSSALVLAVFERGRGSARKLILKLAPPGGPVTASEYRRHSDASAKAESFASKHLAPLVHDPVCVGDGSWILFQEIAGGDLTAYSVLTALLAGVPRAALLAQSEQEPVQCDRETFARVCADIVGGILGDFAVQPQVELWPAADYLRRHFGERTDAGKRLRELANDWPGRLIELPGEPTLPNPFGFVYDPPPSLAVEVPVLLGHAHGDLHTENILVWTEDTIDSANYYLVDLARYDARAPLTADPVQLVLSIINRAMPELSDTQRGVLIDVLAGNVDDGGMLPTWLSLLLRRQRETVAAWLRPSGLAEEWRRLVPLSTLAGALIFMARGSTPEPSRAWFLRLAARCADVFEHPDRRRQAARASGDVSRASGDVSRSASVVSHPAGVVSTSAPAPVSTTDDGRWWLCESLPRFRPLATRRGHGRELAALISQAKLGQDVRDEHAALERAVYGRDEVSRTLPALGGLDPGEEEVYRCPLAVACGRMVVREPSAAAPACHLLDREMAVSR